MTNFIILSSSDLSVFVGAGLVLAICALMIYVNIKTLINNKKAKNEQAHKRQQQIEKEAKRRQDQIIEEENHKKEVAAYQKELNESYFTESQINAGEITPLSIKDIQNLLDNGELTLSSKIKFGFYSTEFNEIQKFKEFTEKFNNFM